MVWQMYQQCSSIRRVKYNYKEFQDFHSVFDAGSQIRQSMNDDKVTNSSDGGQVGLVIENG